MNCEIFTSANLAYLPQATVLAESIRRHVPNARFTLFLVDHRPPEGTDLEARLGPDLFDQVVTAEELLGPDHEEWMFGYDVVEACTAIKGRALLSLMERGAPVIYLDPDTVVFGSLDDFVNAVSEFSVVLTPHQLDPVERDSIGVSDEICTLGHGIYNFGMFGVNPNEEGFRFARWWASRLDEFCVDDLPQGLFVDQRWGDLVPSFFPQSLIYRNRGVNVASWNIHQRPFTLDAVGNYLVSGDPLVVFHFTKATGIGFEISKLKMEANPLVADLWRWYLEQLERHSDKGDAPRWRYGRYRTGRHVPPEDRRIYRSLPRKERPVDPFSGVWSTSGQRP